MIKLLLVDDEKEICEYLKNFFKPRGYNVYTALNGEDALGIVKKELPELVLLDINLEDQADGLEVLRQIKKETPQIKVIMLLLNDDPKIIEKVNSLAADGFIKKPFATDYLEDMVILKVNELNKDRQPPQILIVDDDKDARVILRKFLSSHFECALFEAGNVDEALGLMRKYKLDLIFLDIKMPGKSGMEVIKEKGNLDYKPCIWVNTAFDSEEVARKVLDQGADDYLPKASSLKVLDTKLRDFLCRIGKYKPKDNAGSAG